MYKRQIRHSDLRPAKPARVVEDNTEFSTRMKRFLGVRRFPYPARAGMLAPVSYTHLDVYKRQIQHNSDFQQRGQRDLTDAFKPLDRPVADAGFV